MGRGREVSMTWKGSCPGSTTEGSRSNSGSSSSSSVRSSVSGRLTAEKFGRRQQQTTTTALCPVLPIRSVHFSAASMATVPSLPPTRRPPVLPVRNSLHSQGQGQGRSDDRRLMSDVMMTSIESDVTSSNDFNPSTTV